MPKPPKSLEQHKRDGTYRADRHGKRAAYVTGTPQMPAGCPRPDVWRLVVDAAPPEALSPCDALPLLQLCRLHHLLDGAYEAGDHAQYAKLLGRAAVLWARFGCDPRSRPAVKAAPRPQESDGLLRLLSMREERQRQERENENNHG